MKNMQVEGRINVWEYLKEIEADLNKRQDVLFEEQNALFKKYLKEDTEDSFDLWSNKFDEYYFFSKLRSRIFDSIVEFEVDFKIF